MKRTALILLAAIYFVSCTGMSVDRSYCCGKLISISSSFGAGDNSNSTSAKKDKCCGHEQQSFKVKDSHFSVVSLSLNHPLPAIIPSFISVADEPVISVLHTKVVYKRNAPPGHSDIPVYTLNCAYRI
ncbi:MAG TPA: hypothetical protein VG367_01545 [Mucilaginibacter sp.]|jgi:hypothetical protein|nr:hypothetical protein [Mucilaginibacter sp.]